MRREVKRNGFNASLIESEGTWIVGSCASPPIGTVFEMEKYHRFIDTVIQACGLLNLQKTATVTANERSFLHTYTA